MASANFSKEATAPEQVFHYKKPPTVWVLADDRPGNTTQSIGLAGVLGWPYEIKALHFTRLARLRHRLFGARGTSGLGIDFVRSAPLTPPWPDLVIATGWRPALAARWIRQQSGGCARLVQLARKGSYIAELFDVVVTPAYTRLPPHPRRIETVVPLTRVTPERLAQAATRWQHLFAHAPHPQVALLVGGATSRHRFDAQTAQRLGEEVRACTDAAGGSVFAITSRRTGPEATAALKQGLGESSYVHQWQHGQQDNPYLAYLALADIVVVTGESESMLAEVAAAGKPTYIYPLPERPPTVKARLKDRIVSGAYGGPLTSQKRTRPWQPVGLLCTSLIAHGIVRPQRDLSTLHQTLFHRGIARPFRPPLEIWECQPFEQTHEVAQQVRIRLGFAEG